MIIRGSGVDTNEFLQTTDINNIPVVMLASRMLWDKGVEEFVKAAKRAHEEKLKAKFILVGDVDEDNPMSIPISTIMQWSNEANVVWEGHCNDMPKKLSDMAKEKFPDATLYLYIHTVLKKLQKHKLIRKKTDGSWSTIN